MFYTKLCSIYDEKDILKREFPFDEFHPLLRKFLMDELKLNADHFSPYRFASYFGIDLKQSIKFFLALSDNQGLFNKIYKYQCSNCEELNIITDEEDLKNFICHECLEPESLENQNFLDEVKIIFELNEEENELKNSLKAHPFFDKHTSNRNKSKEGDVNLYFDHLSLGQTLEENEQKDSEGNVYPINSDLAELEREVIKPLTKGLRKDA
ncbi:hypothetical protein ACKXGF_04935 [Alkalibacillus sp. S2W]|uniref:hypothetical protein n=1 Tax=Alkalibacillus sp. S2W TaxID=3386553 RepID=UPI00398CD3B2